MSYYYFYASLTLLLGLALFFIIKLIAENKHKKLLQSLAENWGKEKNEFRNFTSIASYLDNLPDTDLHRLDEKTVADLNINEAYSKIDRCESKIGQQYLYYLFNTPVSDLSVLKEREKYASLFLKDSTLRIKLQAIFSNLNKSLSYSIPNLMFNWNLVRSENKLFIFILSVLPILFLFCGIFLGKQYFLLIAASFLVNTLVHYQNKPKVQFFVDPLFQVKVLSDYCNEILKTNPVFYDIKVEQAAQKFKKLGRYQHFLTSNRAEQTDFTAFLGLLIDYIKITFLLEINFLDKCLEIADAAREEIHTLYKYAGLIDSCISIASYRSSLSNYCVPEFDNAIDLSLKDVVHPLIDHCVPNDIATAGKSLLITGSNMSGKTTFIRTVSINAIMAQSIYTVCASYYKAPFLNVHTSIGISDDLLAGKSYFLEEIGSIYNFIKKSNGSAQANLFVMDELFKGTNTIERIAAAKAVLEYLKKGNNIIMVSTHDLELSLLLNKDYKLFHFQEEIGEDGFSFDHKIKEGALKTRNAIKLLEYFDYPDEIIVSANSYINNNPA